MPKASKNNSGSKYDQKIVHKVIKKYVLMLHKQGGYLFNELPLEELLQPCKTPLNEFFIYRKDKLRIIKRDHPKANFEEISLVASRMWKFELIEIKNYYTMLAKIGALIKDEISNDSSYVGSEPWKFSANIPQMFLCPTTTDAENTLDLKWTGISSVHQDYVSSQSNSSEKIMDKFLNNFNSIIDFNTQENHILNEIDNLFS
ncbi:18972_t:CDS:1, partial [Funneliformis geosporum]